MRRIYKEFVLQNFGYAGGVATGEGLIKRIYKEFVLQKCCRIYIRRAAVGEGGHI